MRPDSVLYLSRENVANLGLSMPTIIDAVENMFREKGEGRVEMPPKPGIHTQPDAFIHAMPAYIPSLGAAGVKWISGYPGNQAKGLPYITGLLILNDPETGVPTAIMDATWLTAQRTGAATAVAAARCGAVKVILKEVPMVGVTEAPVRGISYEVAPLAKKKRLRSTQ